MNDSAVCTPWLERDDGSVVQLAGTCAIGRMDDNHVILADSRVSRHHALIQERAEHEFWLIDLGSSNGTFVNERRLRHPILLSNGDRIEIGGFGLRFRQPGASGATAGAVSTVFQVRSVQAWLLVTDIENSSRLQKTLPPEEARSVAHAFMNQNRELVESHRGIVNQFLGDGVFAYWTDSDTARQRVSNAISDFCAMRRHSTLGFRMALHFGRALVGGGVLGEENLHGPDVNFVFRMEKLAKGLGEPILLSDPAAARLKGYIETDCLGRHPIPDVDEDMPFHRLSTGEDCADESNGG